MGIPHLYTTLRPLATWNFFQDEAAVIDGPALAYHILHICRANGVSQPSYGLLNHITLSWLDSLCLHNVFIRKLYFDGYLPRAKLEVRIARMMRATTRLKRLYTLHLQGCPASYLATDDIVADVDIYRTEGTELYQLVDPCFLVPAVLSCLRESKRYRTITEVVPGEADHFCAADVSKHGGILITSDSDLLVHDLGEARITFLRDLHIESRRGFKCLSFAPKQIFNKMKLAYPEKAIQLAYERIMAPQATLSQLVNRCSRPAPPTAEYIDFSKNYTQSEEAVRLQRIALELPYFNALDPRVSETVLEICSRRSGLSMDVPIKMFLPPLLECPGLRSAWDQSTPIRRLAYSIASYTLPQTDACLNVREFRRVDTSSYGGRQIKLFSPNQARKYIDDILSCAKCLEDDTQCDGDKFWTFLAIALDTMESIQSGREQIPEVIEGWFGGRSIELGDKVAWSIVHISAQIQAMLYSLRVLQQILRSTVSHGIDEVVPEAAQICLLLTKLIPVELYPLTTNLPRMIREFQETGCRYALNAFWARRMQSDNFDCNKGDQITTTAENVLDSTLSARNRTDTSCTGNNPYSVLDLEI
ncbi:hypothetical protein NOR_03033 [Metarhizium rileyi]|uniref:Asteroid domain-containing protein n=1 Tax=Metarhizium rileyi (strain RCEF 4871) TaxID=1649241 RepID=A0A162LX45_METRR|nr:hypothetical protein NOR_03033 [Metarhizium rileyi RCEF 4871]